MMLIHITKDSGIDNGRSAVSFVVIRNALPTRDTEVLEMSDKYVRSPSRRLSKLPVPVSGFRRTKVLSTFTASPLAESYVRLDFKDRECVGSPAKMPRFELTANTVRRETICPSGNAIAMNSQYHASYNFYEQRRMSLAPTHDSLLSTPPQRKIVSRKSLAPNPYGMHLEKESSSRRRSFGDPNRIMVCVRKRPLSEKESALSQDCVVCDVSEGTVSIHATRTKLDGLSKFDEEHCFKFDKVFEDSVDNETVYEKVLSPLVKHAVQGGNSTCFAYGQTGSGKTHTMFNDQFGLCYLAAMELFDEIYEMDLYVSFYEIYQGQLMDLLRNKRKIVACEKDGVVNILGLHEEKVSCVEDLITAVKRGLQTRVTGTTGANAQSSRSHAVLQYTMRPSICTVHGRISFIDLAGSERGADRANVSKITKLEGSEINKSLLALKECIRAMDLDSSRIPFRQSKLTMVLRDSFIGNNRTCMIATVSPSSSNVEHTLNTLRYADRMKETQGNTDGTGEVVITRDTIEPVNRRLSMWQVEAKENQDTSLNKSEIASPKSVPLPATNINATRIRLRKNLDELTKLINNCKNSDMLDLLEEELIGLKSAFSTLT